jgi:hypothetical protein
MKKGHSFVLVTLLLLFPPQGTPAQSLTAGLNIGLGSYSMTSLKALQDYRMEYSGLPAMVTDNFPANWNSGVELGVCFPRFPSRLTAFYQFSSTGARVSSKDYSGEMKLDVVANCNQFGIGAEQDVVRARFFSLSASGKISFLFSEVKTLDLLRIYNQVQREEYRFTSNGGGLEPGIIAGFNFLFFRIGLYGGYLFSFSEELHLQGNRKAFLTLPTDEKVQAEWSGWRAAIKVDVRIPLKKKAAK